MSKPVTAGRGNGRGEGLLIPNTEETAAFPTKQKTESA